jgi:hypothetical protein
MTLSNQSEAISCHLPVSIQSETISFHVTLSNPSGAISRHLPVPNLSEAVSCRMALFNQSEAKPCQMPYPPNQIYICHMSLSNQSQAISFLMTVSHQSEAISPSRAQYPFRVEAVKPHRSAFNQKNTAHKKTVNFANKNLVFSFCTKKEITFCLLYIQTWLTHCVPLVRLAQLRPFFRNFNHSTLEGQSF